MCRKLNFNSRKYKQARDHKVCFRTPGVCKKYAGFTLTEVVIASTLLILAMVPILKALTAAHLNSTLIERETRSLTLCQAKLDDIKARSVYDYASLYTVTNESLGDSYLCIVADSGSGADIRKLIVGVGFDTNGNTALDADEVDVSLYTLIAKRW